jgi:hypothetical protein
MASARSPSVGLAKWSADFRRPDFNKLGDPKEFGAGTIDVLFTPFCSDRCYKIN